MITNKTTQRIGIFFLSIGFLYATKTLFLSKATSKELVLEMTIPALDFDASMNIDAYQNMLTNPTMQAIYSMLKQQYNTFHPSQIQPQQTTRIPKKIHQIWLGNNGVLPKEYEKFQKSWQQFHPDWDYKLWTEKDIPTFPFKNRALFEKATNYGEKSALWRYEILEKEGGLYVDTDFECLAPFDVFHHSYDFYTGISPLDTTITQVNASLIGSIPGHPILQQAIISLKDAQHNPQIITRAGSVFFTRIFYNSAPHTNLRDVAFPASYFYPCSYNQRGLPASNWLKAESFAVHHWAGSWLKQEANMPQ